MQGLATLPAGLGRLSGAFPTPEGAVVALVVVCELWRLLQ